MGFEREELSRKKAELESELHLLIRKGRDLRVRAKTIEQKLLDRERMEKAEAKLMAISHPERDRNSEENSNLKKALSNLPAAHNGKPPLQSLSSITQERTASPEKRVRLNGKAVFSWSYKELF